MLSHSPTTVMNREALSRDIATLKGDISLAARISNKTASPAPATRSATETLDATSIGSCNSDQSQPLAKAYIQAMNEDILGMDKGRSEQMGQQLDDLRSRAESTSEALGEIRA